MSVRLVCAAALMWTAACGGAMKAQYKTAAMAAPSAQPQPLERSVFARDPSGELTEAGIQTILAAPLQLELPARVGVLPIVDAIDWRGPGPSYAMAPTAVAKLVATLRGSTPFTLVTEMMPIPSGALGMEALREMAARYQLRYVLLYREKVATRERVNAWALGYATGIGALFLPGDSLSVDGYVEASLFDVKTGILLFTVRRRVSGHQRTNVWHTGDKLAAMQRSAATTAAPALSKDVRKAVYRYEAAANVENARDTRAAAAPLDPRAAASATTPPHPAALPATAAETTAAPE